MAFYSNNVSPSVLASIHLTSLLSISASVCLYMYIVHRYILFCGTVFSVYYFLFFLFCDKSIMISFKRVRHNFAQLNVRITPKA